MSRRGLGKAVGRRSKFGAVKTVVDGFIFDSKAEATRYGHLMLRGLAGEIRNLELQPWFWLPHAVGKYFADFRYEERVPELWPGDDYPWRDVIEDVKGMKTPVYRLKKKLVEAQYGIEIREIR
jgi:hypothetical protein